MTRLNAQLAADPETLGESRTWRGRRIALERPCAILFVIDDTDRVVRVTHFWTY